MSKPYQGTLAQKRQHRHDQLERIRRAVLTYKSLEETPAALLAWENRLRKLKAFRRVMDMETGGYLKEEECTNLS